MCRLLVCGVQRREYIWLDSDTHGPRDLLSGVRQLTRLVCRCVREGLTNVITFLPFDLNRVCLVITNQQHAYKISFTQRYDDDDSWASCIFLCCNASLTSSCSSWLTSRVWLTVCLFFYLFIYYFIFLVVPRASLFAYNDFDHGDEAIWDICRICHFL